MLNHFALFAVEAPPLALDLRLHFSVLQFFEFAIWGAWFVVLGNYLSTMQFSRMDIGRIYATMSLGAVIAPMFVGTIADQYFASETVMAVLHLAGAVLLYMMAQAKTPRTFYWIALAYALVYSPTIALSSSIPFTHVPDAERDFPTIRVLGTIGWIAAGLSLRLLIPAGQQVNNRPLLLAAALSAFLGVYSFFLPHTPPPASGSGAQAHTTLGVGELRVGHPGTSYKEAPKVVIEGGGGGLGAVGLATVQDGEVKSIEVTSAGDAFTTIPTVTLEGGGGSGVTAMAVLKVVSVKVVDEGSGYKGAPAITLSGGGGKDAKVKATLTDKNTIAKIEVLAGGTGYTSPPTVRFPEPGIPFLKALGLFGERSFAVFFGVSFLITLALAFYYSFTALFLEKGLHVKPENVGPLMTIGQWVEIIFLFTLPWFLKEFGMTWVLTVGMAAWGIRYLIFASRGPLPVILIGVALHGICFDFFFAAGMIHANTAPDDIKASAQSLFGVLTYGLGMWLGTEAAGWLNQRLTRDEIDPATGQTVKVTDWTTFWLVPAIGALISLGLFLLLF